VTTRLVQLLVIAIVAVGVFIAVSSVRDATEPAATVPGAVIAEAGAAAAASSLRAVAAAMEAYREPETLAEFLADMDRELGPVPPEVQAWARAVGESIDSGAPTPPRPDVSR